MPTPTLPILICCCAVTGLASAAVTSTVKVAEVPFKVIGGIVDDDEDADESERRRIDTLEIKEW